MFNEMLFRHDKSNMFDILKTFPKQIETAIEIGKSAPKFKYTFKSNNFLILGMGGSAIGGDILRTYAKETKGADKLLIQSCRDYSVPGYFDNTTNVIASSYSGDTEETLSALKDCIDRGMENIVCISSGGKLTEMAKENNFPLISIPGGLQPRCALGSSFFPLIYLFLNSNAFNDIARSVTELAIEELKEILNAKSKIYSELNESNPALNLAKEIFEKIPIIYSSSQILDAVNLRWRCQIQENAKNFVCGNLLPEMNHNEINSFRFPSQVKNNFKVIFLKDILDNDRVKIRFDALEQVIDKYSPNTISLTGDGKYFLSRIFDLIYLGDWTSYYLALLNETDPTPIPEILFLKDFLSGKK